ncbi:maleylpyruvate isomerase family mycothiol-dependent enzyme [Kitasatospora sp. NPDC002227]|uniref:maleylpyruvate isomerase family mycothiol-dependent enzyme n=1 Tax=Kitasatospora sp. NPDC002227 TaxID=3154773 RepID=UPI00333207B3
MTPLDHGTAVAAETTRFVAAVQHADPSLPVPTCPDWTLADLVRHTGSAQRWFTDLLGKGSLQPPTSRDVDLKLPESPAEYPAWLGEAAAEAAAVWTGLDLDAPMWAWGADQHARFWVRRMAFETLVHRVDAELALGLPADIDPALAADGVAEFLTNLPFAALFAPKTAELRAENRTIRFARTDGAGDWLVRLRPDSLTLETSEKLSEEPAEPADATVRGTAADLLLLLYGRLDRTSDRFEVHGDDALLAHWFAHSAF